MLILRIIGSNALSQWKVLYDRRGAETQRFIQAMYQSADEQKKREWLMCDDTRTDENYSYLDI